MPKPERERPAQSLRRRALSAGGTVLTLALAVGLVSAGTGLIAARAADTPTETQTSATPVALAPLQVQPGYVVEARLTGPIEAARSTDLGFEAGGTLLQILVDEGDRVREGQVLARLDTRTLEAERSAQRAAVEAATAQRDLAQLTADRQSQLAARDFASGQRRDEARFELAVAEAEIARSAAALEAIEVALSKSQIVAPYDGVITARVADDGARLSPGQVVLGLQDTRALVRVGLPEDLAAQVSTGAEIPVRLSSSTTMARLERLRPDLDPATRTRAALLALPADTTDATGTLAEITLVRAVQTPGAWVPLSALSEGVDGLWTVFVLPAGQPRLSRVAVTLEHVAGDAAFVAGGLPDGARVVTAGTHRLSAGQLVTAAGEG